MAIKYTNLFHFTALQNLPKWGFLVSKHTIWQLCSKHEGSNLRSKMLVQMLNGKLGRKVQLESWPTS
jgi:hypothetical protein